MNLEQKIAQVLALAKQNINSNYNYINDIIIDDTMCNFPSFNIQQVIPNWSSTQSLYVAFQGISDNFTYYPTQTIGIVGNSISNIKTIFCLNNQNSYFKQDSCFTTINYKQCRLGRFYITEDGRAYEEDYPTVALPSGFMAVDGGGFRQSVFDFNGIETELNSITLDFKNVTIGEGTPDIKNGLYAYFCVYDANGVYGLSQNDIRDILEYDTPLELKNGNIELYRKFNKYCFNYFEEDERPEDFNSKIGTNYYYTNIVHTCDSFGDNDTVINQSSGRFEIPKGSKIWGVVNDNYPYNVTLYTDTNAIKYYANRYTDEFEYITELPHLNITYTDTITDGNGNFAYGILTTNIPIWKTQTDANRYKNGQLDASQSLNSGGGFVPPRINRTGKDLLRSNDIDSYDSGIFISNSGGYATTHLLTSSQLSSVFNLLYNEETNPWEQIKNGLRFYGENPIESLIDLYYCPIDLEQFSVVTQGGSIMFGSYQLELSTHPEVISSGKMVQIANTMIVGTYHDYRDYENTRLYLYLPFVGMTELSIPAYMDKLLTIQATFDVKSHNMKYWLFADNQLVQSMECSLGVSIPVIASDFVGKAQQNIQAINSLATTATSVGGGIVGGVGGGVASAIMGGASAMQGKEMETMQATQNLLSRTPKTISGNQSSATACYDVKYPFLVFETVESLEPTNLIQTFGKPTNEIGKLINYSGYTLFNEFELETYATEEEKILIYSQSADGIII